MGKSKCKKARRTRVCPTGLPSLKELEREEEMEEASTSFEINAITNSVKHIIDLLQSPGVEDKECGACSIANIASQPGAVPVLLKSNIIKILGPLLVDPSSAVRHSVSGALRNLSVCGGHEACDVMVEEDIMTPLVVLLKTYEKPWRPVASSEERIDSQTEIFIQGVHLLWNLCESSSIALSIFNKQKLLPVLTQCLCVSTYGTDVVVAVAQCLHTVSEDNEDVTSHLNSPSVLASLQALLMSTDESPAYFLLRALAAGILLNMYGGQLSRSPPSVSSVITRMFETTLNVSCSTLIDLVVKMICKIKERNPKSSETKIDKFERREPELEKCYTQCSDMLTAKQIILELLTNICCSEDADDWDDMDSSDTGSDETAMDGEMEIAECWDAQSKPFESCIPREIQEAIMERGLLGKILDHLQQLPEESCELLKECSKGQEILKKVHTVKCRALLCVHNIIEGLDKEEKGTVSQIYPIWSHLAQLAFKQIDFHDTELLEASTSALRALTQTLAATADAGQLFQETSVSDMHLLFQVGQQCPEEAVRVNVIRIVGTIGCVLAGPRMDGLCTLVKNIGMFLLEVVTKDSHLWVVAEALDCIFDVFGEDHLDPVAQEILLVDKLKTFLPILKGKINQQKRTLGQHHAVIATAKTNLHRFIQYKTKPK